MCKEILEILAYNNYIKLNGNYYQVSFDYLSS